MFEEMLINSCKSDIILAHSIVLISLTIFYAANFQFPLVWVVDTVMCQYIFGMQLMYCWFYKNAGTEAVAFSQHFLCNDDCTFFIIKNKGYLLQLNLILTIV